MASLEIIPVAKPEETTRHFRRVSLPATVYFTVEVPADPSKDDIRLAVNNALLAITDAEDRISVEDMVRLLSEAGDMSPFATLATADVKVHFAKAEEKTIDGTPIFKLKGLTVVDRFTQEPEAK